MKVAITSTGSSVNSKIDKHFGRCIYFVFYDTELDSIEFLPNINKDKLEEAGNASAQIIANKGVKCVISGDFGEKVKPIFDQLQIQLIMFPDRKISIKQIIEVLKNGPSERT